GRRREIRDRPDRPAVTRGGLGHAVELGSLLTGQVHLPQRHAGGAPRATRPVLRVRFGQHRGRRLPRVEPADGHPIRPPPLRHPPARGRGRPPPPRRRRPPPAPAPPPPAPPPPPPPRGAPPRPLQLHAQPPAPSERMDSSCSRIWAAD